MTDQQDINRAELARQVLENPIYTESVIQYRASLVDQWASTKWFQYRKRQEIWRMYRCVEAVEHGISKVFTAGKLAARNIAMDEKLKKVS
jgi:hypothetical protein